MPIETSFTPNKRQMEAQLARTSHAEFDSFKSACRYYKAQTSDYERIRALPAAWVAYEREFPDTAHGKSTKSDPEVGSSRRKTFAKQMAGCIGRSRSTIYAWHEKAIFLAEHLDADAESMILGTAMANKVGFVHRIACLPDPEIQRNLVKRHVSESSKVMRELKEWEVHFALPKLASKKTAAIQVASKEARSVQDQEKQILSVLGIASRAEVVPAIERLKSQIAELERKLENHDAGQAPAKEMITPKAGAPTYLNDNDRPYRDLFRRLVRETAAEFSGACKLRVLGGREDHNTAFTSIDDGVRKWKVEWHRTTSEKMDFSFESCPWAHEDERAWSASGDPKTVAEVRGALRKLIRTQVIGEKRLGPAQQGNP